MLVLHILKRRSTNPVLSLLVKISSELPLGQRVFLVQKGHLIFPSMILFCMWQQNMNIYEISTRIYLGTCLYTSFAHVVVAIQQLGLMLSASQDFKTSAAKNSLYYSPLGRRRARVHLAHYVFQLMIPSTHLIFVHIYFFLTLTSGLSLICLFSRNSSTLT